jgi:hypothetical protein
MRQVPCLLKSHPQHEVETVLHKSGSLFLCLTCFSVKFCVAGTRNSLSNKIIVVQVMMVHTSVKCVIRVSFGLAFSNHTLKFTQVRNHSDVIFAVKALHDGII